MKALLRTIPEVYRDTTEVTIPDKIEPVLSALERKAYQLAHRILSHESQWAGANKATPGGRRSARVDAVAKIIIEEFEHGAIFDE